MTAAVSGPAKPRGRPRGRPWPKGVSGNPSGFPKEIAPAVAECRRLALSHAPHAIERLAGLVDSTDERVAAEASRALLDRAGLAPRAWEGERVEVAVAVDVDALRASLAQRLDALVAARSQVVEVVASGAQVGQLPESTGSTPRGEP